MVLKFVTSCTGHEIPVIGLPKAALRVVKTGC